MEKENKTKKERTKSGLPKKKRKRKKKMYFTQVHEQAILDYVSTDDLKKRDELFREYIGPVFKELITKIVYTFKFNYLPNIEELKQDCLGDLITLLDKFDVSKGYKAFAYYSVVTKNWFIARTKKNKKKKYIQPCADLTKLNTTPEFEDYLINHYTYEDRIIKKEFFNALYNEMETWLDSDLKEREKRTTKAIMILLKDLQKIPHFKKNVINSCLRELTSFKTTKQLTNSKKNITKKYKEFKRKWDNGEI